jgi:uncharacterized protein YdeI (BOF family)
MAKYFRILLVVAAIIGLGMPASAWNRLAGMVVPIDQAQKHAKSGDRFVIEGIVMDQKDDRIFHLRDDSGDMYVLLPNFLRREYGLPKTGERIRVAGRYDIKHLDREVTGMRVQEIERLGKPEATRGKATPEVDTRAAAKPAARAASTDSSSIAPTTSAEWKDRLAGARQELLAARKNLDATSVTFAHALREAGEPSKLDPAILEKQREAETRVARAQNAMPALIEEARADGVSPQTLDIYERSIKPLR